MVNKIQTALKISIMVGVGGSIGLMCIIKPTNVMLFENSQGSNILAIICLLILFSSIIITISSILQGLGVSILPAGIILLGFSIKCLLNIPFVLHFGTLGAAIASVVAMIVILILLSVKLTRVVGQKIMPKGYIQTIAFASLIMGSSLLGYIKVTDMFFPSGRFFASLQSLTAVMIGGALYLIFVLKSGVFKEEELVLLPLGSKLIALLPKK